ncbi:hypothetical protein C2E31_13320 [Rhodopirellula baltica]|nr:hypothetical protein C2E31_13320 [Rhodopirellula baltica]
MIWIAFFLLCLGGTAAVSIRRPGAAIGLMIVMFGLEQLLQSQSPLFIQRGNLVNVGVGLVSLFAASRILLSDFNAAKPTPMQVLTLLIYGLALLSGLWTLSPEAFRGRFFSQWPYFVLYFAVGPVLCSHQRACEDAAKSTVLIGAPIMLLIAFACEWTGRGIRLSTPSIENGRMVLFAPPLAAASCAAVVAVFAVATMQKKFFHRLATLIIVGVCAYIIVLTQSRGQLVSFCVVMTLVYAATNRTTSSKGLIQLFFVLVILSAMVYAIFIYVGESGLARWRGGSVSSAVEGRTYMSRELINRWLHAGPFEWLLGMGESSSFRIVGFYVHNIPIEVLCELGVLGFLMLAIYYWRSLKNAILFAAKIPPDWQGRRQALGLVGVLLFHTFLSVKEGHFTPVQGCSSLQS